MAFILNKQTNEENTEKMMFNTFYKKHCFDIKKLKSAFKETEWEKNKKNFISFIIYITYVFVFMGSASILKSSFPNLVLQDTFAYIYTFLFSIFIISSVQKFNHILKNKNFFDLDERKRENKRIYEKFFTEDSALFLNNIKTDLYSQLTDSNLKNDNFPIYNKISNKIEALNMNLLQLQHEAKVSYNRKTYSNKPFMLFISNIESIEYEINKFIEIKS